MVTKLTQNNKVILFLGFLTLLGTPIVNHFFTKDNIEKAQQHSDTLHYERYYSEQEILGAIYDLRADIKELKSAKDTLK